MAQSFKTVHDLKLENLFSKINHIAMYPDKVIHVQSILVYWLFGIKTSIPNKSWPNKQYCYLNSSDFHSTKAWLGLYLFGVRLVPKKISITGNLFVPIYLYLWISFNVCALSMRKEVDQPTKLHHLKTYSAELTEKHRLENWKNRKNFSQ